MVMRNPATGRFKTDLPALYDELEAEIRALESLGRTQVKVPKLISPVVINELNRRGIVLSDLKNEDCEIDILIGANVAGLLLMDGCIELQSGLFLLKTRLGYVLTRKQGIFEKCNEERDTVLNVISLLAKEMPVKELWNLESIGVFDPIQKLNEKNEHLKEAIDLSSNKDLAWKRHKKMDERAQRNEILDNYKVVFQEWEEYEIIERIKERLVAWVLRFINNVRSRISDRKKGQLSLDELESAEIQLIRSVQAQSFTDKKLISNLSVFRDDNNIIRVKTRITGRIDASNFLSPILLPNNCGRRTVRKIWNACVKCRKFKSKSLMTDPVSLPSDRVKDAAVFEVVGVDLASPLYVKRTDFLLYIFSLVPFFV
ncbi:uncharacterized protein TNCV_4928311 [Trichonephila clavipes]|nr:uncharacterized protein TNCV_4928311 [Trichonephila clavipes]